MKSKHLLLLLLMALLVPWAANAQKPVPYNEGFENFSTEADLTADGWISAGASSCYIGITTSYYSEGSKALLISAWDGSNSSDSEVAALPILNTPINQLQITLSYRQRTGGTVRVGYLTDADDASTFVSLKSLPSSTSGFTTTTVELNEAPSTAARIAIQQYTYYDCYIDDIEVKALPNCKKPSSLEVISATTTSVTLGWTNGDEGQDAWQICLDGDEEHLIDADTNPFPVEGLETSTTYTAKVRANCGNNEYSDWSTPITIATNCEATDAEGYSENLDSYTGSTSSSTNNLPLCWKYINTCSYSSYSGYPIVYNSSNYASSTPNCLRFYSYYSSWSNYDPQPQYAILPPMEGLAGMQVTLQAKGYNTSSTFKIGTMSNPTDASTFTMIAEQTGLTTSYQEFQYIVPATCTDSYLAIMIDAANSSRTSNGVYIDDITIGVAPTCIKPTGLELEADGLEATFTWESTESQWQVAYSTDATADPDENIVETLNTTTYSATLEVNNDYYFWVRSYCSATDQSEWAGPASVHIGYCVPTLTSSTTSYYISNFTTTGGLTGINNSTTGAGHSYSDFYNQFSASAYEGQTINFTITIAGGSTHGSAIWVDWNNDLEFGENERVHHTSSYTSSPHSGSFTVPAGTTLGDHRMRIVSDYSGSNPSNPCSASTGEFEDYKLIITEVPSCLPPTGLDFADGYPTDHSVSFTWDYEDGEVFQFALVPGSHVDIQNVDDSYFNTTWYAGSDFPVWNILNADQDQSFFLRKKCSDTDFSTPVYIYFHTKCEAETVTDAGWGEDFNGYTGTAYNAEGVMPNCWDVYTTNTYAPHVVLSTDTYNYSETNALVMPGGSSYNSYVALPEFSNDLQTLQIGFKWGTYYSYGTLTLGYIKDNDVNFSTFTTIQTFSASSSSYQTLVTTDNIFLNELPADASRLAFKWYSYYSYANYVCVIDDVEVSLIPTCWQPQNLTASAVTNEGATLTWVRHAMSDETAWVLQYGEDDQFESYIAEVNVETNPTYTIENGLTAATTYYARVKPACDTDGNLWSEVLEFETEPDCAIPTGLAVTSGSETPYGATITWNGRNDSFVVEYGILGEAVVTPVYEEGFEDADEFAANWTVYNPNSGETVGRNTSAKKTDEYGFQFSSYSGASANQYLISPLLSKADSLVFAYKGSNSNSSETFRVGYSTTTADVSSFTIWEETKYTNGSAWQTYKTEIPAGAKYFAINYKSYNLYYLYIDDIVLKNVAYDIDWHAPNDGTVENTTPGELGSFSYTFNDATLFNPNTTYVAHVKGICGNVNTDFCEPITFTTADDCPAPIDFAATAITRSSATVTWNGGFATEWKVWIRKSTQEEYPTNYDVVTTASKPFEALESGTKYFVKIAPTCDETKTLEDSFTTAYAAPFVQNFDANAIPADWARYTGSVADAFNGTNPTTTTSSSGMWGFNNTNVFGQYHARVNTYGTYSAWLTTPNIDLTSATDASKLYLLFDLATTDFGNENAPGSGSGDDPAPGDDDQFRVLISTDNGATWTEDDSWVWMNEGGDYDYSAVATKGQTIMLPLASYASGSVMIAFYTESGSTTDADFDVHIDNVKVCEVGTYTRTIAGYGDSKKGGYALVATPVGTVYSADLAGANMITDPAANYDLYSFDQAEEDEWRNYKTTAFNLTSGKGYLYANKLGTTITFIGVPYSGDGKVNITNSASAQFPGWNLIGNPFATPATIDRPFYKMNETGDGFTAKIEDLTNTIAVMEGVFVETTEAAQATFTPETSKGGQQAIAQTNIVVCGEKGQVIDNAIIRFDGGQQLGKFSFREGSTKVYIPMEGNDYAVVSAGQMGEMPVNFKAEHNGTYTLSFTSQEVSFSYLHLIDNMTGDDVNLLETPSYSFSARTTDYDSRFRLVFATGSSVEGDNFGFINAGGNLCIFGIEGEATVQVVDMLGHVLSSNQFSGSYESKLNVAPGVYMIRLINGNDVKVQKMVVR